MFLPPVLAPWRHGEPAGVEPGAEQVNKEGGVCIGVWNAGWLLCSYFAAACASPHMCIRAGTARKAGQALHWQVFTLGFTSGLAPA